MVRILAYWYSNHFVRWKDVVSTGFRLGIGTRQGGVLYPFLFSRYIRDLSDSVSGSGVGCFIGNQCVNILAYADDLALPAPSWHALQLLNILNAQCCLSDLTCNVRKTVCMIFMPKNRHRLLSSDLVVIFLHSKLTVMTCTLSRTLNIWVIL